ncbi:hypothetical protein BC937DRAFT_93487 [Endogone sp. FLAS-F59071]|nr:hypothetical protein BC937DRAFT_93487 [Endogone sp. FLAS-F59071]|eukprot:RUS14675.1 hypothetical protein BC937DRAFT_93487 [Endogone sp. FLAS-F59071]
MAANLSHRPINHAVSTLASDSEAFIKADREPEVPIEALREESVRVLNANSEGKSGPNRK